MKNIIHHSAIQVTRSRFREDDGDLEALAQSILRWQLEPIVIDSNNELIAGYRRWRATQLNESAGVADGTIWAEYQHNIDEEQAREMELEENIQRKQMTAAETIKAIAELDRLKSAKDPSWGQTQTAEAAGIQRSQVSTAIKYARMVDIFPELKDAKSIRQLKSWADAKAASVNRVQEVKNNPVDFAAIEAKILLGDSTELIKTVQSESFHAIITDPPFGIIADNRRSGTIGSMSAYEDSTESYRKLLGMAPELYRVLRPNGWLIWFLGISWYEEAKLKFRESGFTVDEIPIVWDRSDGRCHTNRPDHYFGRGYDIALHCFKGSPELVQRNRSNVLRIKPVDAAETLFERPVELYAELIKRLTIPGETVADFFVGSGSCPAAAASLGRDYFGIELSETRRAVAIKKIRALTPDSNG